MPIKLNEENGGKILIIQVTGKLAAADYAAIVPEFERLIRQHGRIRVLFEMTEFHGWQAGAAWQDLKLGLAHFADIERLALAGEAQWQRGMAMFCKPFTRATVRYFDRADVAKAREWLEQDVAPAKSEVFESTHLER